MALTMKVESVYPSGWRLGKRPRRPRNWYLGKGLDSGNVVRVKAFVEELERLVVLVVVSALVKMIEHSLDSMRPLAHRAKRKRQPQPKRTPERIAADLE